MKNLEAEGYKVDWIEQNASDSDGQIDCDVCRSPHADYRQRDQKKAEEIFRRICETTGEPA